LKGKISTSIRHPDEKCVGEYRGNNRSGTDVTRFE